MRIIMKDGAITGPCEAFTYGEVEDYTINLQTSTTTACSAPTGLSVASITSSGSALSWLAVTGASNYTVQYKKSASTSWTSVSTTSTSYSLTGLSASTVYNWQVRTNCSSGSSAYTVGANFTTSAATATSCSDAYESNNTQSAAKSITVNSNVQALLNTSTDVDWFKFSNTSTQKNIRVTLSGLPADYDLRLYSSTGTLLATSANGGLTTETIKYNNGTVGTYFVRVYGYNGAFNATSCYTARADISSTAFKLIGGEAEVTTESENSYFEVYPNPNKGFFNYKIDSQITGNYSVSVMDSYGRIIYSEQIDKQNQLFESTINLENYSDGIYFVVLDNGSKIETVKLLINKN
jgi:hypothetical protein